MAHQRKLVIAGIVLLLLLTAALIILLQSQEEVNTGEADQDEFLLFSDRSIDEISYISVENKNGFYDVKQVEGGFILYDIPAELVNGEYLRLLLDESARITVKEVVSENPSDLSLFGLAEPQAKVGIEYSDGTSVGLLIGREEPLSDSVYIQIKGNNSVYLMPRSYTIRFTMPVENYIQYEITPSRKVDSALAAVRDVVFSGYSLPEPIVIQWVDEKNKDQMRKAASFGIATHLILSPGLHELDQAAAAEVFQSMLGIVSEGIIAYNCDDSALRTYGFDNPYLSVDFIMVNGLDADPEEINLKIVKKEDGSFILTCNDNRVIYMIQEVAFTKVKYEDLVMRWFLTPFITDLEKIIISSSNSVMVFELSGNSNKDLSVKLDGKQLDINLFRSYFRLLTSACNDGELRTEKKAANAPSFTVEYFYKDVMKDNDLMKIYDNNDRTVLVEINGITEFAMKKAYLTRMLQAEVNLGKGLPIEEGW